MKFNDTHDHHSTLEPATVQRWYLQGFTVYIALGLFVFSLLGLRDIVITAVIRRFIKNSDLLSFLDVVYWMFLIVSVGVLAGQAYLHRAEIKQWIRGNVRYLGHGLVSLVLVSPFLYLAVTKRLFLDYWLDEVMSIYRHIVPSISSALFWYPVPNNHIFSNAMTGVYLQLIGHPGLEEVVQTPVLLRVFYLGFGVATIVLYAILMYRFLNKWSAWIAVILFCTTIPYLNFVVQVRGYSPTMFFSVALLFFALRFRESHTRRDALWVVAFSTMLFYTIPSNLYYLVGLGAFFVGTGAYAYLQQTDRKLMQFGKENFLIFNPGITLGLMIGLGLILGGLFYLPVLPQVIGNRFVETNGFFQGTAIPAGLVYVLQLFISNRIVIFTLATIGLVLGWISTMKQRDEHLVFLYQLNTAGFLLPFVVSFIRGDRPYDRVFLVTLPCFIFLTTLGLHYLIGLLPPRRFGRFAPAISVILVLVYSNLVFFDTYQQIEQRIYTNLIEEKAIQVEVYDDTLWASHHLDHYYLNTVIDDLRARYDGETPVLIDHNDTRFPWVIEVFLEAYEIPFINVVDNPDESLSEAYMFVSFPERSLGELHTQFPNAECTQISDEVSVYRLMWCQFSPTQ